MKATSLNNLKLELLDLPQSHVVDLCLRLCRYKKENKELLTYLLFESGNEQGYIQSIQKEMDELFLELPRGTMYHNVKFIRKILRLLNKFMRYSGSAQTSVELLLYFLKKVKETEIPLSRSTALNNLHNRQIEKIRVLVTELHEDLQYDYLKQLPV